MSSPIKAFADLPALVAHLRQVLEDKKTVLLYAYNGTGKTRLSMAFKDIGKQGDARDMLYFNAFTEDLFSWDNDLNPDGRPGYFDEMLARIRDIRASEKRFYQKVRDLFALARTARVRSMINKQKLFPVLDQVPA